MAFLKNISPHSVSDQELVTAYRQSADLTILAVLYQRYMDLLYGVCLKYLKEPETAKDAVMAIFEELAQKLRKHEVDNFKGWCYTLAKNYCLMQLRSSKRIRTGELKDEPMQTADELHLNDIMEKEEHLDKLSKCLETLSSEQKTTVELFYLQSKCYKEIETITGLEWNKVRSHIQNGRRNLKICMDRQKDNDVETTTPAVISTIIK
ncbi:MAG TPA: sigma-70 family RNA polymerase sigma factor [Puia sp.]|nr:sigma-70 family RNA polymerase sigma factor [Puia sp.]